MPNVEISSEKIKEAREKLFSLIEESRQNELECRDYIHFVIDIIIPPYSRIDEVKIETRGFFGSSDYIISGVFPDDSGKDENRVYIFELKAPQCYIFEKDENNQRLRPTKDLVKAENQLIHDLYEARSSESFQRRFNVPRENIHSGGIIIGCNRTIVHVNPIDEGVNRLYHLTYLIRRKFFYEHNGIKMRTWDSILRSMDDLTESSNENLRGTKAV